MRTLHVISHTHWDREWHQTFQQFRLKLVQLVDGLLDILDQDPQFKHFMLDGQTIVLDDYLLMRPDREATLRGHVQTGRILIGPWHILPDMFLVGPEAHIRNLLEGERSARRFGPKMMIGYMPDSFGHIGQMPQILRGFGIDNACLWRGLDEEPAEFWWQSPDGSRVLMAYLRDSYSNGAFLPNGETFPSESQARFTAAIAGCGDSLAAHSASSHQLIMLGTDHMPPPPNTSRNIAHADANLPGTRVLHSTLPAYLESLKASLPMADLPVVQGELRKCRRMHLLPGVLSTRIWIKQRNHASENLLSLWAEPSSVFAELAAPAAARLRDPGSLLRQAWRMLMENHPHDSICGCSIDQVHVEMQTRFDQVDQLGEQLTRENLEGLARAIQTNTGAPGQIGALVVFNPLPTTRSETVSAEVQLPPEVGAFELVDESGAILPFQTLGQGSQDLINTRMNPAEFRSAFGMVNEGRITGLGIRAFTSRRDGPEVRIDVIVSQQEPDAAVWQRAQTEATALLADPGVTSYLVRARTASLFNIIFNAPAIPGLGWRAFGLRASEATAAPAKLPPMARFLLPLLGRLASHPAGEKLLARLSSARASNAPCFIENETFRVEVEPAGTLSILDKRDGRLYSGLNRFEDSGDAGDEYNYSPPASDPRPAPSPGKVTVQTGPVRQVLELELRMELPAGLSVDRKARARETIPTPIHTTISLAVGVPRIDIHTRVVNRASDHRLRVHFPTPFPAEKAAYDGHFEIVSRPTGLPEFDRESWIEDPRPEAPQRAFTSLSDGAQGFTLANRGLPEIEVIPGPQGGELALTLLRCVGWLSRDDLLTRRGHAGPALPTPGAQMHGEWGFDYSIIPHGGEGSEAAQRQALAFDAPLRAITAGLQDGGLPATGTFLRIEPEDSFILSAIKPAEAGSGWLVRGWNPGAEPALVKLTPFKPFNAAALVSLAEEKQTGLPVDGDGSVTIQAGGRQIISVWFG